MIPEQTEDMQASLKRLKGLIELSDDEIKGTLERASKSAKFLKVEIKDNLDWEEVATIEVNLPDLPGISIDVGEVRDYPDGMPMAHLIGYVGAVSEREVKDDPLLSLPGFKIGKTGVEKRFDEQLRGVAGASEVEVNVVGREVRELRNKPSQKGKRLMLTVDSSLQNFTQARLALERSASAVVMNAKTGEVYALASYPSFDPNVFARGIPSDVWEELLADAGHPLTNKAVAGQYPPGSTFKMVTALAGLEAGKISRHTRHYCPGFFNFGNARFHCWKQGGHGSVNVVRALAESCDTYFYEIANDVGIDRIAAMSRKLGLGKNLDFDLTEERPGLIPDKDWKRRELGQVWHPGETIVASIGQGYVQATPLQLAIMTARLVNGGFAVKPWLAGYVGDERQHPGSWPALGLKKENLELVLQGMYEVVNTPKGTALGSRINIEGQEMGGKTGTAQVKRITRAQREAGVKNEDLPWKDRHHALFVGYAPVHDPVYVCSVVVEHGVGGSKVAAPIAKDLLMEAQKLDLGNIPFNVGLQDEDVKISGVKGR
ncbi:MAG: penicillin-binding protein 2 [Alphaproteobacteria bacterium]|nr:penicillin-binding protein 2 [Alphaproteobacteria bacterium]